MLQNDTKHALLLANGRYSPSDIMYLVSDIMYFKQILLNMCPKSVCSKLFHRFIRQLGNNEYVSTYCFWYHQPFQYIWVFPKIEVPQKSSILIGFSIINHPFWEENPLFLETSISMLFGLMLKQILNARGTVIASHTGVVLTKRLVPIDGKHWSTNKRGSNAAMYTT